MTSKQFSSVARIDIGPLLPKTIATTEPIRRNLTRARRSVDQLRRILDKISVSLKELESRDELENFEIQDLMGQFNEAEALASKVLKKRDDTANSVIGKT
jgi:hypothetical protein